ncbi:MAG: DUF4422 domain-containing protein [Clostridia bacterium]|nr:DUF4422 domain-containing protein [Clostridia bacterium]
MEKEIRGGPGPVTVIVAAHKPYWMPEDPMYLPVQVGAAGKIGEDGRPLDLGFRRDDSGENISEKNPYYCELTGLYWAWKNLPKEAGAVGLAHYRRHFLRKGGRDREDILGEREAEAYLRQADALLPRPRNYWIETNYSQYAHAHHGIDLDETRQILAEKYPEYLPVYDAYMRRTRGHRFNMFIMRRDLMEAYCRWLFDILLELEGRLDISGYNSYDRRVFGFVAELLLDVWLEKNEVRTMDLPYLFLEKQNWLKKGAAFLGRKIRGGKK